MIERTFLVVVKIALALLAEVRMRPRRSIVAAERPEAQMRSPLPHLRRDCADLLFQEDQIGAVVTKMAQFHKRFMDTYR